MPPRFEFVVKTDMWAPLGGWLKPNSAWFDRGNHMGMYAIGKLRQGISVNQADTEMRQIAAQLEQEYPAVNSNVGTYTRLLQTMIVHEVRSTLLVLMGAVGFVLLIACVNVANLSLARALVRQQEMGIRMALGAGTTRLIRQMLSESLVLAVLGGLAGILAARWLLSALISLAPPTLPRLADVHLNGRVLLFTAALTLLTGLLFGILPAWSATRTNAVKAFGQGGRSSTSTPLRRRLFDGLLVAEIALALVVLTGAGLMTRTMYKIANVDPGFRTDHLLTMRLSILGLKYNDIQKQQSFMRDVLAKVKALPGVESAAFTLSLPMEGSEWGSVFIVGDQPVPHVRRRQGCQRSRQQDRQDQDPDATTVGGLRARPADRARRQVAVEQLVVGVRRAGAHQRWSIHVACSSTEGHRQCDVTSSRSVPNCCSGRSSTPTARGSASISPRTASIPCCR